MTVTLNSAHHPDDLISAAKLAAELGLASSTLRSWRPRNFGPKAIRIGRAFRYRRVDIEKWLQAQPHTGETLAV